MLKLKSVVWELPSLRCQVCVWMPDGGIMWCPSFNTEVKSALEVIGDGRGRLVTSSPTVRSVMTLGSIVTPPPSFPYTHIQHNTHTHTTLLNLEELRRVWPGGGCRENLEWSHVILHNVG